MIEHAKRGGRSIERPPLLIFFEQVLNGLIQEPGFGDPRLSRELVKLWNQFIFQG